MTDANDIRGAAEDLAEWLSLPGAEARYAGANVMASWLRILLTSVTPDAEELLADEVEAVKAIILGGA